MPVVALGVVVVAAGCMAAVFVASKHRQSPARGKPRRRRYATQQALVDPDPLGSSGFWQPDFTTPSGTPQDPIVPIDYAPGTASADACAVEFDDRVERDTSSSNDDSCSVDSSDSSSDSSDSSSDSGSSD
jgi:hypothetical protein